MSTLGSKGKKLNILIKQGDFFGKYKVIVTALNSEGVRVPYDLSNKEILGQIRKTGQSTEVIASFSIECPDPESGIFFFYMGEDVTASIPCGEEDKDDASIYVWEMQIAAIPTKTIFYGKVNVFRDAAHE